MGRKFKFKCCEGNVCFAFNANTGRCSALNTMPNKGEVCPFYKSVEQAKKDEEKAQKRIKDLGIDTSKYY